MARADLRAHPQALAQRAGAAAYYAGGTERDYIVLGSFTGNSGNALKAVGQGYGDGAGTNTTGFSALLGGYRNTDTDFYFFHANSYFWTSSQYDATTSSAMILYDYASNINYSVHNRGNGFSVRCIKD